jgi:predicted phage terminase large subunit-like protein
VSELSQLLADFDPNAHSDAQLLEIERLSRVLDGFNLSERGHFGKFCQKAWHVLEPQTVLKWNWHLDAMAAYLEAYAFRDIKRLILNIPPGGMKSLMVSVFLPAWIWTWDASRRYINLTNEKGLAIRDSRRMRDLIQSDWYRARWGQVFDLSHEQQGKELFENTEKGFRQGLGFTGNISGKRGTDLIIDDPIDTKKAFSDVEIASVNDTYDQAVSSRLNDLDHDGIVLIMQRTRTNDLLTGHILGKKQQDWVHFKVAMEYEGTPGYDPDADLGYHRCGGRDIRDKRKKLKQLMFPERFSAKAVAALKEDLGEYGTAGQLNQNPTPLGGGIIKKKYWRIWPDDVPIPKREHVFLSWDTAYSEKDQKNNAYSACIVFGIFWHEQEQRFSMMVLGRWYEQVSYPVLRKRAQEFTLKYEPDAYLIEKKASGQSLVQDLRRAGSGKGRVRIRTYMPDRDKVSRAYAATAAMSAGQLYIPNRAWATELIAIVSEFPNGPPLSADLTDCLSQGVLYLKSRWWITHPDDDEPDNMMPLADVHQDDLDQIDSYESGVYG